MSMKKKAEECDELISLPLGLGIDDDVMMLMMIVGANVAASTLYPSHHSSR